MEDDIISIIFEKKEDDDMFNFKNEELSKWTDAKRKYSDELFNFISQRVHPKSQKKLIRLMEQYIDAHAEYFYCENKMYYRAGFTDGISIVNKSLIN
jgi:hypothetical protein